MGILFPITRSKPPSPLRGGTALAGNLAAQCPEMVQSLPSPSDWSARAGSRCRDGCLLLHLNPLNCAAFRQLFTGFLAAFSDVMITNEDLIAEGDEVASRRTSRAHSNGNNHVHRLSSIVLAKVDLGIDALNAEYRTEVEDERQ